MASRASNLGNDPDYQALYRSVSTMGASILRSSAALTKVERKAQIARLRSNDSAVAVAVLESMGTSVSVLEEQSRLVGVIAVRHHLPQDAEQLRNIFDQASTAAKWSYADGSGPAPDPLDEVLDEVDTSDSSGSGGSGGSDNNDSCYDLCALQAAGLAAAALTTYLIASAACTAAGPFGIFCFLAASASYAIALYEMDAAVDRCVANCG